MKVPRAACTLLCVGGLGRVLLFHMVALAVSEDVLITNQPICSGRLRCSGSFACIEYSKICDGFLDCPLGDDESSCTCTETADCPETATCVSQTDGSMACKRDCYAGYMNYYGRCVDFDECKSAVNPCGPGERCVNTMGSYRCECVSGYFRNETTEHCEDIDECSGPDRRCKSALCVNSPGSFECRCPEHFEPSQYYDRQLGFIRGCSETNYCLINDCVFPLVCKVDVAAKSRYVCVCAAGYVARDGQCVDIDECIDNYTVCNRVVLNFRSARLRCENLNGTYACRCANNNSNSNNSNSSSSSSSKAVLAENKIRIDKCQLTDTGCNSKKKKCPKHSQCVSGVCLCDDGYQWNDDQCEDVDECHHHHNNNSNDSSNNSSNSSNNNDSNDSNVCHQLLKNAQCFNLSPGYECRCSVGYRSLETSQSTGEVDACVDIDECAEGIDRCTHTCRNTVGSYSCSCPPGHTKHQQHYCYPYDMPKQLVQLEDGELRLGTLLFDSNSTSFERFRHTCKNAEHPTALAYDPAHMKAYLLSSDRSTIFCYPVREACQTIVSGRFGIAFISVDYLFENVYWIEGSDLHVKSVLTGRGQRLRKFDERFRSMTIVPSKSFIGLVGERRLYVVDLDGNRVQSIYDSNNNNNNNNSNISQVFFDADSRLIVRINDELRSCPTFDTPINNCTRLKITLAGKTVIGVFMSFVLLINEKSLNLELISESSRQQFSFRLKTSNDSIFVVVPPPFRSVNDSVLLCAACHHDLCLNSASNSGRCTCGNQPCHQQVSDVGRTSAFSSIKWHLFLIVMLIGSIATVLAVTMRRYMRRYRNARSAYDADQSVCFDTQNNVVNIDYPHNVDPCIGISMRAQLIQKHS